MDDPALPGERHAIILRRLAEDGRVLASTLARDLGASEDTIRRDLRDLANAGRCKRVYGGALQIPHASTTLRKRDVQARARKEALARTAVALVRPGNVIMIDAGSTNSAIARALPEGQGLTVITNAPSVAANLAEHDGVSVLVIGGRLDRRSGGTLGARAVDEVRRIKADLYFVGTFAVSATMGISVPDQEEAVLKEAMFQASTVAVSVVTADKIDTFGPFIVSPVLTLNHLVVETGTELALLAPFRDAGITVHVAGEPIDG